MPKKKQPSNATANDPAYAIVQVAANDPTIYDLDTAIQSWTTLVNNTIPSLFNTINYLKGIIDTL